MSFWSQLNPMKAGSVPPQSEQQQQQQQPEDGYETDEDKVGEPTRDAVLSPKMPPPMQNVFQHHPSPFEKTTKSSPHRGRPLDPVFKAAEGTFPALNVPDVGQKQSSNVHIFVPSMQRDEDDDDDDQQIEEAPDMPPSSSLETKTNTPTNIEAVGSAPAQEESTNNNRPHDAAAKTTISDHTLPAEPLPPPSISRATRRVPPPPPRPPRKVSPTEVVETSSVASEPEDPPPPVESESSDNEFVANLPPRASHTMFTPTVDRGRRSSAFGESSSSANHHHHHHHQMVLFETPNRLIRPSPKFVFFSDQKMVPDNIKRLEEATMKRRREMLARMKELDCRIARLVSTFAQEKMDLDLAIRDTLDRSVCHPLEVSVERLTMERESSAERGPALLDIEKRLSALDHDITKHIYMTMSDAKREELDGLQNDLFQEIIPSMRLEDSKSDKIEGGVVRRFENVAGIAARQFHQEAAARRASVEFVKKQLQTAQEQEHRRGDDVLEIIKELRAQVQRERLQRQAEDKSILDEIIRATVAMKRAMLSAVSPGK